MAENLKVVIVTTDVQWVSRIKPSNEWNRWRAKKIDNGINSASKKKGKRSKYVFSVGTDSSTESR